MTSIKMSLVTIAILASTTTAFAAGGGSEQTLAHVPAHTNTYAPADGMARRTQSYAAPSTQADQSVTARDYNSDTRRGPEVRDSHE